jgi:hypothetical protein
MERGKLKRLATRLHVAGHLAKVIDRHGKIVPTPAALEQVDERHADEPPDEKYRLAQAQTLLNLAEEHQLEDLN